MMLPSGIVLADFLTMEPVRILNSSDCEKSSRTATAGAGCSDVRVVVDLTTADDVGPLAEREPVH